MNSSNNGKIITLKPKKVPYKYKGKKNLRKKIVPLLITGALAVGAFVAGHITQEPQIDNIRNISRDYAKKLLERTDTLTIAKQIFANEYNDFYGEDLSYSDVIIEKQDGVRIVNLEDKFEYNVIYADEKGGCGEVITYTILDENGKPKKTYYSALNIDGTPILTIEKGTFEKFLKGDNELDIFETKRLPKLYQIAKFALLEDREKDFENQFIEYLKEQGTQVVKTSLQVDYDALLKLKPRSEKRLEITGEDINLIYRYYARYNTTCEKLNELKRKYGVSEDDYADYFSFLYAVEDWINSDNEEAKDVKKYLQEQKELTSVSTEELLDIFR